MFAHAKAASGSTDGDYELLLDPLDTTIFRASRIAVIACDRRRATHTLREQSIGRDSVLRLQTSRDCLGAFFRQLNVVRRRALIIGMTDHHQLACGIALEQRGDLVDLRFRFRRELDFVEIEIDAVQRDLAVCINALRQFAGLDHHYFLFARFYFERHYLRDRALVPRLAIQLVAHGIGAHGDMYFAVRTVQLADKKALIDLTGIDRAITVTEIGRGHRIQRM